MPTGVTFTLYCREFSFMILFSEDSSLWVPRESTRWPGYFYPPFQTTSDLLFGKDGTIISSQTGEIKQQTVSSKGYNTTAIRHRNKYHVCAIHRSIAVLFVPKPDRHKDIPFDELQVNHMDGNKLNNDYKNLEWVTQEENMEHARQLGLFSNDVPCRSRDVVTGEILYYRSFSQCARENCIPFGSLAAHVTSSAAGRIVANGRTYLLDDESQWPSLLLYSGQEVGIGKQADVIARNVATGDVVLASTFRGACDYIGLIFFNVRNSRNRKGPDVPYQNWLFYSFEDYLKEKEEVT